MPTDTCLDCDRPVRSRGCCPYHYRVRAAAGTLPPATQRKDLEQIVVRVIPEVIAALERESSRTGESRYRVAQRWLEERAARRGR